MITRGGLVGPPGGMQHSNRDRSGGWEEGPRVLWRNLLNPCMTKNFESYFRSAVGNKWALSVDLNGHLPKFIDASNYFSEAERSGRLHYKFPCSPARKCVKARAMPPLLDQENLKHGASPH